MIFQHHKLLIAPPSQGIIKAMLQGMLDSITGTAVVFYLDREVNKKLAAQDQQQHHHVESSSGGRRFETASNSGGINKTPE